MRLLHVVLSVVFVLFGRVYRAVSDSIAGLLSYSLPAAKSVELDRLAVPPDLGKASFKSFVIRALKHTRFIGGSFLYGRSPAFG